MDMDYLTWRETFGNGHRIGMFTAMRMKF
jgi:hypothetical protein